MTVEFIDEVFDKVDTRELDNEIDETSGEDPNITNVIKSSGTGRPSRDPDVRTDWTTFYAPLLYDNVDEGACELILVQGSWFDWRELEDGGIVYRYDCEGWLSGGYPALVDRYLVVVHAVCVQ